MLLALSSILVFCCFFIPINWVLFLLGVVLPLDTMAGVNPAVFDVLRYGFAIVFILRSRAKPTRAFTWSATATVLITLVGLILAIKSVNDTSISLRTSTIFIGSVVIAYLVARTGFRQDIILRGFVWGCCASAIDILFQYAGLPFIGVPVGDGIRYSGFSFSSTNVSPFLAIAIIVVLTISSFGPSKERTHKPFTWILRIFFSILLLLALIVSGGRGGLFGLSCALAIAICVLFRNRPITGLATSGILISVVIYNWNTLSGFVSRTDLPVTADFASGRGELNAAAFQAIIQGGFFGPPSEAVRGLNPHTPLLSFGITAGAIGVMVSIILVLLTMLMIFFNHEGRFHLEYRLISAVMFSIALLEPSGFFVGFSKVLIFMIVLTSWDAARNPSNHVERNSQLKLKKSLS